jgi:hypothetical protein
MMFMKVSTEVSAIVSLEAMPAWLRVTLVNTKAKSKGNLLHWQKIHPIYLLREEPVHILPRWLFHRLHQPVGL